MVRDFIIWYDDIEWEIRESGLEDYSKFKQHKSDLFAHLLIKDSKIVYMHDISLSDEDIKSASLLDICNEECRFFVNSSSFLKNTIQKEAESFKGSFIDALKYVKEVFNG